MPTPEATNLALNRVQMQRPLYAVVLKDSAGNVVATIQPSDTVSAGDQAERIRAWIAETIDAATAGVRGDLTYECGRTQGLEDRVAELKEQLRRHEARPAMQLPQSVKPWGLAT